MESDKVKINQLVNQFIKNLKVFDPNIKVIVAFNSNALTASGLISNIISFDDSLEFGRRLVDMYDSVLSGGDEVPAYIRNAVTSLLLPLRMSEEIKLDSDSNEKFSEDKFNQFKSGDLTGLTDEEINYFLDKINPKS